MVLKKSNCSLNSGNTLKVRYYDKDFTGTRDHLITKVYINRIIQPADFEEQNANILSTSDEYVQDGDLAIQHNFRDPVVFSLNKRKRWLLRETVAKTICYMAEENCEEDFKITLVDNVHYGYTYFKSLNIAICREYWDSHNIQPHVTPRKNASYITDLRKRGKMKEEEGKVTRRRKHHNQHFRAIQRKVKMLPPETELHQQPFIPRNLAEPHGCPEIRYELWSPAEYTSRKSFYKTSPYERIWDKDPTHNMRRNKALKKSKGLRSKRDKQESHFGFSPQGVKEQADQEQEHPGGLGEEWMWELDEVEEVKERERAVEVDLQTLMMKEGSRKKKRRKKGCKADMVDKETYVFVTDDRRKKVKVEVKQINRATSLWTKKYEKGCAIVLENRTKVIDNDDDFEIVDRNTESEKHSDLAGEMLELMKNHLQVFNGNFCVCKVAMEDIVPRKLAELYGHGVEVSLIHPYTFVINLGRSQGHWCMVCQMSPGLGFWPDPESQTNVAMRVTLQGRAAEPDICTVNSSLRHAVKQTARSGHTLTELFALANKVIEETLQQALLTTKSRAHLHGNRTIHKQLFSELTVVKTAEEAYLEDKHDKQVLPSVARIDLLTLIDLDFDLIEECSICFASWEGEEWSWISHNVSLLPCQHSFCRQCWQLYLCQNIKEGKTTLHCMEYGCQTELDPATVTSLVPPEFLTRWQQQCAESHVTQAGGWHWCPKAGCQYLAKMAKPQDKKSQRLCRYGVPVQCHCGELWCLLCQKSPHWPALCSHGDIYYKMLLENGNEMGRQLTSTSDMTYFVKLKNCPRCHYPMEKDGGCSHMTCKCSHHFCWVCLGDWDSHVHTGLVCASAAKKERTVELDSEAVMTLHASQYNKSVTHRYARKKMTTMYIRSKVTQLVNTQRKKMWKSSPSAMNTSQLDATQAFLTEQLVLVRDLHRLLENCNVLLSNTPRSCQPKSLLTCTSQLAFTTSRLEVTLNSPALRAEMLTRMKSLSYLARSTVDQLVLLAPVVQATVDRHSRQSTRQGTRSQKGN